MEEEEEVLTFVEYLCTSVNLISFNFYTNYEAAIIFPILLELKDSFRKVNQFVDDHMTDLDKTLVCLQSPRTFHWTRITEGDEQELQDRQRDLTEIWVLTLPFPSWMTLVSFLSLQNCNFLIYEMDT